MIKEQYPDDVAMSNIMADACEGILWAIRLACMGQSRVWNSRELMVLVTEVVIYLCAYEIDMLEHNPN